MNKIFILLLLVLMICNIPPVKYIFRGFDAQDLSYANYSGTYTFAEINLKERNYETCLHDFAAFKASQKMDTILYRINARNYWKFWNYYDYLTKPKYRLPYMNWEEIAARRGKLDNRSGFQDF